MSGEADVVIVGGGIHGAALSYECARRGWSVRLFERDDFGGAASSSSLKILHGGLRYLQSLDVRRSVSFVRDRRRWLRIAPDLVLPLRCRLELGERNPAFRLAYGAGLLVNEIISSARNRGVTGSRHLPRARYPYWYDAIVLDTERLLLTLLDNAVRIGAGRVEVRNYAPVEDLVRDGGRVAGVRLASGETIRSRAVVRCVGAHRFEGPAALGMNVVVGPLTLTARGEAVALTHPVDGRNAFCVPWRGTTMIGTRYRSYEGDRRSPLVFDSAWVDEMLAWLAEIDPVLSTLSRREVRFVHAGLLPLRSGTGPEADRLVERSRVETGETGLLDVVGVKYTTALGTATAAAGSLASILGPPPVRPPSEENEPPLLYPDTGLAHYVGVDADRLRPVVAGVSGPSVGQVLYAVEAEQARSLGDVLLRRTAGASAGHPGRAVVEAVADLIGPSLGWTDRDRAREIAAFDADWRFAGNVEMGGATR